MGRLLDLHTLAVAAGTTPVLRPIGMDRRAECSVDADTGSDEGEYSDCASQNRLLLPGLRW